MLFQRHLRQTNTLQANLDAARQSELDAAEDRDFEPIATFERRGTSNTFCMKGMWDAIPGSDPSPIALTNKDCRLDHPP